MIPFPTIDTYITFFFLHYFLKLEKYQLYIKIAKFWIMNTI